MVDDDDDDEAVVDDDEIYVEGEVLSSLKKKAGTKARLMRVCLCSLFL